MVTKNNLIAQFIIWMSLILMAIHCDAHESRPLHLSITESSDGLSYDLSVPSSVDRRNLPSVILFGSVINDQAKWTTTKSGYKQIWRTASSQLKGSTIAVQYPSFNPVLTSMISINYQDGESQVIIIPPNEDSALIPVDLDSYKVSQQYTSLGIEHILAGIDHLLFVVCLLLITGFSRKLWITITGFTIAHSITLILSALEIIRLPIPPIEATIALSIVFLCYEIIHHHWDKNSLTYRFPILVSSSFGLLHGLGFAAVLGEIGLPVRHTIHALLFFNIGVESGQVIFILVVLAFVSIVKLILQKTTYKLDKQTMKLALQTVVYIVGITASYWMFDRLL